MLTRLYCWLFQHTFFDVQKIRNHDPFLPYKYKYIKHPFCIRCGYVPVIND